MTTTIFLIIVIVGVALTLLLVLINRRKSKQRGSAGAYENNDSRIYIGNLHYRIKENELGDAFEKFGPVLNVKIVKNRKTGRSKGFAFITFASVNEANQALSMDGFALQGRPLVVKIAKQK